MTIGVPIVGTSATATSFEPGVVDHTIDVDVLYDGHELFLGGVLEHVEEGGSVCALPPITLGRADVVRIRESTGVLADRIEVRGLVNLRYALVSGVLHVLEATSWAGRTIPFVSRATGVPLVKAAARIVLGSTIAELRAEGLLPAQGDGGTPPPGAAIAVRQSRSHGVDEVDLVVNTTHGRDDHDLYAAAVTRGIPHVTTVEGLSATVQGIEAINRGDTGIVSLQEHAAGLWRGRQA